MSEDKGTITVRLVRSFEHRNIKHIVLHDIDFTQSVDDFVTIINNFIPNAPNTPVPFKKFKYDTMKVQHHAFGAKTSDPVINSLDDDKLILKSGCNLKDYGVANETEISYFKLDDYKKYQANPQLLW